MRINKINYEQYALDYLEGTLDAALLVEMEAFLEQHPHIQKELEEMQLIMLVPDENLVFENKADLMHPIGGKGRIIALWGGTGLAAIAAMLLVVWMFWGNIEKQDIPTLPEIVENPIEKIDNNNKITPLKQPSITSEKPKTTNKNTTNPKKINHKNVVQNKTPKESPTMLPKPQITTPPQNSTTPKTPVARKPKPIKNDRPIAIDTKPSKPNEQSPNAKDPVEEKEAWTDVEPLDHGTAVVASTNTTTKHDRVLKIPSTESPTTTEKPVSTNSRRSKLNQWGLVPERSNRSKLGGLKKALTPEGFSNMQL